MRTVTITCDRCGAPATQSVSVRWVEPRPDAEGPRTGGPYEFDMMRRDLCPACLGELRAWLDEKKEDR